MNKISILRNVFNFESPQLVENFCRLIAVCIWIKLWSFFQFHETRLSVDTIVVTACFFLAGFLYFRIARRLSALLLAVLFFLMWHRVFLFDYQKTFQNHHVQLLILMLIGVFCLRQITLQHRIFYRGCGIQFIRLVILTVYAGGILTKITPLYLNGHKIKLIFLEYYWGNAWLTAEYDFVFQILALLALITEVLIVIFLLTPRWKKIGVYLGIAFHIALFLLMPISVFSFLMIAGLLTFNHDRETSLRLKNGK